MTTRSFLQDTPTSINQPIDRLHPLPLLCPDHLPPADPPSLDPKPHPTLKPRNPSSLDKNAAHRLHLPLLRPDHLPAAAPPNLNRWVPAAPAASGCGGLGLAGMSHPPHSHSPPHCLMSHPCLLKRSRLQMHELHIAWGWEGGGCGGWVDTGVLKGWVGAGTRGMLPMLAPHRPVTQP